jgi:membrane-bound metal-dependent hydrolase YbcI (DUF457 family)
MQLAASEAPAVTCSCLVINTGFLKLLSNMTVTYPLIISSLMKLSRVMHSMRRGLYPSDPHHSFTHSLFFFFLFAVLGFELRAYTLSYSASPFFRDRVSPTICPGWLGTAILLISAS